MGTVWVVTDESKSGYDAGGIFIGVFSTYEKAAEYVKKFAGELLSIPDESKYVPVLARVKVTRLSRTPLVKLSERLGASKP